MPVQVTYPVSFNYSGVDHTFELQENYMQDGLPAFQFRKRNGEINWRKLSALDVERVARELDFITLQENISTVTFCNIDAVSDVDPLVAKLFKLAQFIIEYLLHSQEYLQSVVNEYEVKIEDGAKCNESLQQKINELNGDVAKLKEENKKRRRMIQQQQMLIEAGASSYYQCPHCEKAFMNVSFLQGHMQRRHPGSLNYIGDVIAHSQREQSKLGNQLKQLEGELKTERDTFNLKLLKAEEEKKKWTEESQRQMDEWKKKEETIMMEQMDSMRASFLEDIGQLKKKEETYQQKIAGLQETMDIRHSNLGELVDDLEDEKQKLRDYEDRMLSLEGLNNAKNRQISGLMNKMEELRNQGGRLEEEHEMRMSKLQMEYPVVARIEKSRIAVEKISVASSEDSDEFDLDINRASRADEINAMKFQMKQHLKELLDERLRSSGVDPEASRLSTNVLTKKLMVLKAERRQTAQQIPEYYQIRESSRRSMMDEARKLYRPSKSSQVSKRSPSATNSQRQKSRVRISEQRSDAVESRRSSEMKKASKQEFRASHSPQQSRPSRPKLSSRDSFAASPLQRQKDSKTTHFSPSTPHASARKRSSPSPSSPRKPSNPSPTPVPRTTQQQKPSPHPDSDEDDISNWDDDLLNDDDDAGNRVTVVEPNVKNLARKLEFNLSSRKKPPVGAVDLSPQQKTKVEEFHLSDDDDDSFLVSSLEEEKKDQRPSSSRVPSNGGLRQSAASTSSNTFGTSVWGSGQKPTKSSRRDEFDSDDDLDIDELMT